MDKFRSAFTKEHLISADSIACIAGNPIKLGEYVVPAGETVSVGYGHLVGQESADGRLFMDLQVAAGTPANGTVRLSAFSPQNRPGEILFEFRTETLRQSPTDRTKQIAFPEHALEILEDKKIVLEFIADSAVTVDKAKSTILMDITKVSF